MKSLNRSTNRTADDSRCSSGDARRATRYALNDEQPILDREISFISNDSFEPPLGPDGRFCWPAALPHDIGVRADASGAPAGLPPHLRNLCRAELLTASDERNLFWQLNYSKYCAHILRERIYHERPDPETMRHFSRLLDHAQAVRDQLIESNVRLVVALARKYVTPQCSFDDLLSEGLMILISAVEKFDYNRGFRFSTYAYRAISRGLYRAIGRRNSEIWRLGKLDTNLGEGLQDDSRTILADKREEQQRKQVSRFLEKLNRREQFILRGRFALGAHRRRRTFRELAERLGVSKERVRQLEQRAILKIRRMAENV